MVFYNSLKNCAKNSNHNKLEITSRGSPSVMLRLSLLMDSAFVYINCWAHFDGSIEKWRKNLNCYRKPSSTSFARFLSSLSFLAKLFEFHKPVRIVDKQVAFVNFSKFPCLHFTPKNVSFWMKNIKETFLGVKCFFNIFHSVRRKKSSFFWTHFPLCEIYMYFLCTFRWLL